MVTRRRIDWSVLPTEGTASPTWTDRPAPSDLVTLIHRFTALDELPTADQALRRAVELCLDPIGLVRAGIYLYDEPADLMLGAWGTNLDGELIDEHHVMFELGADGGRAFTRSIAGEAHWTVIADCPLVDLRDQTSQVVGCGWVVSTPVRFGARRLGMLFNDPGRTETAIDPQRQALAALLCAQVGVTLRHRQHSNQFAHLPGVTARHPTLRRAVHRLTRDPALGGDELARDLGISVSHLARLFKSELGLSLVDYRNQLRLERFAALTETGCTNLLDASLAAGFGSYAQFHRVFSALRGQSPRAYLAARGIRLSRRAGAPPTG